MKKYSSIYPMIFGIICLIAGLIVQQPGIVIVFGIVPILLSILLIHSDRKAKKKGLESNTEMLNRVYQERKQCPTPQPSVSAPKIQKTTVSVSSKQEAISTLRKKIIDQITKAPTTHYELASLLWADASRCFPTNYSFNWDGAWFKLDLETMGLYADVGTYPNQFGASRDDRYKLTAYEFHQKAMEFQMAKELQCMETEADWMALLDDSLKAAIAQAQNTLAVQQEKEKQAKRIANAIVIPDHFANITPTMDFREIVLKLSQRYGSSCVYLTQNSEKYLLHYGYSAMYSSAASSCQRELSAMEAAWVEQQVRDCMNNTDSSTWQSLPGGDRMSVKIIANKKPNIELHNTTPKNKYYILQHLLHKLAEYGSLSESEKKNIKA